MDLIDQVYNGDYQYPNQEYDFPDGWEKTGGDSSTLWQWLGQQGELRTIAITHPGGPRAGIIQAANVPVQAGEGQKWELQLTIETEPAGVPAYARVYLGAVQQVVFSFIPEAVPKTFSRIVETPSGTTGIRIEVGIFGQGTIYIHDLSAYRLYPLRTLRLDNKGQVYVNHVESIGRIQSTVPVKIVGSLPPVEVDVHATVTNDIRDLTPNRDGVRIYSSTGGPMLSAPDGSSLVRITGRNFTEFVENVTADTIPQPSFTRDMASFSVYSYAVYNSGAAPASINLEVSPEGFVWAVDTQDIEVAPGELKVLTANRFLRFNHLVYWSNSSTTLTIWLQAQS